MFFHQNRFYNPHMKNRFQLTYLPKIRVKGILSEEVYTNQKLMIFLNWFEKRNDPDLINATYDGAFIKGLKHISSREISFPERQDNIFNAMHSIYQTAKAEMKNTNGIMKSLHAKCTGMKKDLILLIKNLERAVILSADLLSIVKDNKKDSKLDYILNKLSETDKMLNSENTLKEMIGFTVQRVIHTITEGYEIDGNDNKSGKEELAAKRSHFLYKGILEGSVFNLRILDKMIKLLSSAEK